MVGVKTMRQPIRKCDGDSNKCRHMRSLLTEMMLDDEFSNDRLGEIAEHVMTCDSCGDVIDAVHRLQSMLFTMKRRQQMKVGKTSG